jgi:hypothetical protein
MQLGNGTEHIGGTLVSWYQATVLGRRHPGACGLVPAYSHLVLPAARQALGCAQRHIRQDANRAMYSHLLWLNPVIPLCLMTKHRFAMILGANGWWRSSRKYC